MMARSKISTLVIASLLASAPALAESPPRTGEDAARGRYEGGNSSLDRPTESVTAMDQSNAREHVELTAAIRSEIVKDRSLSVIARNIKIVTTKDGTVWLRGPVRSEEERGKVLEIVKRTASGHRIEDGTSLAEKRASD